MSIKIYITSGYASFIVTKCWGFDQYVNQIAIMHDFLRDGECGGWAGGERKNQSQGRKFHLCIRSIGE